MIKIKVNGKPVKSYVHDGKVWVEGRKGCKYTVQIQNNTFQRVLALTSIDGLSVLTGEPASDSDSGYIIRAFNSIEVKGFRTSDIEVSQFEFSDKEESYAVKSPTGEKSAQNCGVIGVRLYGEVVKQPLPRPKFRPLVPPQIWQRPHWDNEHDFTPKYPDYNPYRVTCSTSSPADATANNFIAEVKTRSLGFCDVGTKFAESTRDEVKYVDFERGEFLEEFLIYYASRESLIKMGVISTEPEKQELPKAFKQKYCQPPKND